MSAVTLLLAASLTNELIISVYSQPTPQPTELCDDCVSTTLISRSTAGINKCYRYEVNFCNDDVNSIVLGDGNADVDCGVDLMDVLTELDTPDGVTYSYVVFNDEKLSGLQLNGLMSGDRFRVCYDRNVVDSTMKAGWIKYITDSGDFRCQQSDNLPDLCAHATPSPTLQVAGSATCDSSLYGDLSAGDIEYWSFSLTEGDIVTFDNCYTSFDPKLYILDENGVVISYPYCDGDDCGTGCPTTLREKFTMPLDAGTYYIKFQAYSSSSSGSYQIDIDCGSLSPTSSPTPRPTTVTASPTPLTPSPTFISLETCDSLGIPFPTILYNGYCYATIGGVDPFDTTVACENTGYVMPNGWRVAKNIADSDLVGAAYPWGTHIVIYGYPLNRAVGCASTTTYSTPCENSGRYIKYESGLYSSSFCSGRILIRRHVNATLNPTVNPTIETAAPTSAPSMPTASPTVGVCGQSFPAIAYNGNCYATIGGVDADSTTVGCEQSSWYSMPNGWGVAEKSADSALVGAAYPWGTHVLVYGRLNRESGCTSTTLYDGSFCGYVRYDDDSGLYSTSHCHLRVLIKRSLCDCYSTTLVSQNTIGGNKCYRYQVSFCNDGVNSIVLGKGRTRAECRIEDIGDVITSVNVPRGVSYDTHYISAEGTLRGLKLDGLMNGDRFRVCFEPDAVDGTMLGGNIKYSTDSDDIVCMVDDTIFDVCGNGVSAAKKGPGRPITTTSPTTRTRTKTARPTLQPTTDPCSCNTVTLIDIPFTRSGASCYKYQVNFCNDNYDSIEMGMGNPEGICDTKIQSLFQSFKTKASGITYDFAFRNDEPKARGIKISGLSDGDEFQLCFDSSLGYAVRQYGNIDFLNARGREETCRVTDTLFDLCPHDNPPFSANAANDVNVVGNAINNDKDPTMLMSYLWAAGISALVSAIFMFIFYISCIKSSKNVQVYGKVDEDDESEEEEEDEDDQDNLIEC